MAKRDIELIVALAEGRLEDESEARALIEASPKLRSVYLAQVRAIEATSALPAAHMTDTERAALRRDLWASLRVDPQPVATSRSWGLQRLGYAAGAALLAVGMIAVASRLGGGQDTAGDFASDRTATENAASATTAAAAEPGAQPLDTGETTGLEFADHAERLRLFSSEAPPVYPEDGAVREGHLDCLAEAGLEDQDVLDVIVEAGWRYLAAVPQGEPIGPETPIAFVDEETCRVVHLED